MNRDRIVRCIVALLLSIVFILTVSANIVVATQLLIKGDAKYLGKKIGENEFETCNGNIIEIGKGEVKDTDEKCPPKKPPTPKAKKAEKAQ